MASVDRLVSSVLVACGCCASILAGGGQAPMSISATEVMAQVVQTPVSTPHTIQRSEVITLRSGTGLPYVVSVSLPSDYERAGSSYPVVYILDGDWYFVMASSVTRLLAAVGEMPSVIVVAVGYGGTVDDQRRQRSRDYTPIPDPNLPGSGAAMNFLAALEKDIVPFVERRYRTTGNRTIVGHSLGGLFAVFAMLERPTLFTRYVIGSAALWNGDFAILAREKAQRQREVGLSSRVFLLVGEHDGMRIVEGVRKLEMALKEREGPRLRWTSRMVPGASHQSSVAPLLADGLRWVYEEDIK